MSTELTPATKRDIRAILQSESTRNQIAMVLPQHLTAERMTRVMLTAIVKTPKLGACSPESLLQALMLCSQAGLEPDGRNAHLIPYGDQVQVIFDWKGLVALAKRNGIQNIAAEIVCENDDFSWYRDGEGLHFKHTIDYRKPRGGMFAAFCIWKDGAQFDGEVMTKDEIDGIRKRSKAAGAGPWVTDYNEMAKKTVIRRASKKWPLASEVEDDDVPNFTPPPQDQPKFTPRVVADPVEPAQIAAPAPAEPKAEAKAEPAKESPKRKQPTFHDTAKQVKAEPKPEPKTEPAQQEPDPQPPVEPEPPQASTPAPTEPGDSPAMADLKAAMKEEGVTSDQVVAFATKKGVLKDGADKDLATMADILLSKIPALAKMIRAKGQALKEIKGEA